MSDEKSSLEFYQTPSFLERHVVLQQAWSDSLSAIKRHYIWSVVYGVLAFSASVVFGLSTASAANIVYCALVSFILPLVIILAKNFIAAPAKIMRKQNEKIGAQESEISSLKRQIDITVAPQAEERDIRRKGRKSKVVIPLFDERERRESIIALNNLIQDANKFLEDGKNEVGVFIKDTDTFITPNQMFVGNALVWKNTKVKPFIESRFGRDFFELLNFDKDALTFNAVRRQIRVLKGIVEELENDSPSSNNEVR